MAEERRAAYVDTSVLVAIVLGEPKAALLGKRLLEYDLRFASGLVEAELKAVLRREAVGFEALRVLPSLEWVSPTRSLSDEIDRVLASGYVKGADVWHLGCALYVAPDAASLRFETLDSRQREVALALGFA